MSSEAFSSEPVVTASPDASESGSVIERIAYTENADAVNTAALLVSVDMRSFPTWKASPASVM